jgi:hypothetical protein
MTRSPTTHEIAVINRLLERNAELTRYKETLGGLRVVEMNDGGMGGLRFAPKVASRRVFGGRIADGGFEDADGVPVLVSLLLDPNGDLFELEFAKTDFSALARYPEPHEILLVPPVE